MKSKTFLIAFAFLFLQISSALSQEPNIQWDARFGGGAADDLYDILQTNDGGYIAGGNTISPAGGDKSQGLKGEYDYWIVKMNADGVKEWDADFGGFKYEYFATMLQTNDGGYLLGGSSESGIGGDKTQHLKGGATDFWILKTDANGVKEWDADFGGSESDYLLTMCKSKDGGYMLGGYSYSGISGDKTQDNRGGRDYWIVKIDSSGVKEWDARFGGTSDDVLTSVEQTSDDGYILGGYSYSPAGGDKSQGNQGLFSTCDYWIVKIDVSGTKEWDVRFGGNFEDRLYATHQTSDGGYILGGSSDSQAGGDKTQDAWGNSDFWLVKTNSNGIKQWDYRYGGYGDDGRYSASMQIAQDGGFIIGAYSYSAAGGDKTEEVVGHTDYWVVRTDENGILEWDDSFIGAQNDYLEALVQASDGGYVLAGYSDSPIGYDKSQAGQGGGDYWIVKTTVACDIPKERYTDAISSASAKTHWNIAEGANKYKVRYRVSGTGPWTITTAGNTYKKLKDLLPSTQYDWQVKSICTNADLGKSSWSSTENFTTLPGKLSDDDRSASFKVYPNPISSHATLEFTLNEASQVSIRLFSVDGKEVRSIADEYFSTGNHELNLSCAEFTAGIYFLEFKTSSEFVTKKIVIE